MVASPQTGNDILIFDRTLVKHKRQRAAHHFSDHNFLFQWSKHQLSDRLHDINRTFDTALHIGSRSPLSAQHDKIGTMITLDLPDTPVEPCTAYIQASEELLPIAPQSMDLILSNLNLHTVNDLPGALLQIRNSLKDDGLFMASIFGGETLHELRKAMADIELSMFGGISPRVAPFADKPQMGDLLQRAKLNLPIIDSEIITVTYDSVFKLLHDIRGMGESNAIIERSKAPLNKEFFMRLAQKYHDDFAEEDGRIVASFEIIFLHGWAPHSSQQKPLRPGSAENSLAEALGSTEIKTGEKATP
ncbi:MAG: SAM-dependent methyltransferase [Alphaproteobacteria bacterium]|nr:MAG: SAM-dependent methyltransferase [Alphaproteobacteria bacterium]